MFVNATTLEKLTLQATDGEMGKIKDLYFDESSYTIRYLTFESKKWFPDQVIYLSPSAVEEVDLEKQVITVNHKRDELSEGAGVKEEAEMTPEREEELASRMNWSQYWVQQEKRGDETSTRGTAGPKTQQSRQLRSINHLKGIFNRANVVAEDGIVGPISDAVIEIDSWNVRYFQVDCGTWSTHPLALISPDWITDTDWDEGRFRVDLTLHEIEEGPIYKKGDPITREFELKLYQNYKKSFYWT
ncbi:PRC-barrel domain-containing protein [Halobacillus sp. A1]|uniref:PRC-barrel domain-containing protein n=1 Tax=Halobacillus sp. A1 TaxID=2880262 RepID=UPI0020A644CD|nr:PRC-barrel domain-containing protein [Halobacillus sp. A1]MCP3031640.1 PRC-barrel domain-containing protein [Halobacillus sp. A1]